MERSFPLALLRTLALTLAVGACSATGEPDPGDGARPDARDTGRSDVRRDVPADQRLDVRADARIDAGQDAGPPDQGFDVPPPDMGPPRCGMGIDTDGDGLDNDAECTLGSDPFVRDTDMDGLSDGAEARYPRVCVATDRMAQRRPAPACMSDTDCRMGERCLGLDPTRPDSDMDGVPDLVEDRTLDGMIDGPHGETDPRLWDTDGDGSDDSMGGVEICRPSGLASVTQRGLPGAPTQIGHDPRWTGSRRLDGTMMRSGVLLEEPAVNAAGAVFAIPSVGDLRAEQTRVEGIITTAIGTGITAVLVGRSLTTHEMNAATTSTYRVARSTTAVALRDLIVMPMIGVAATPGMTVATSPEFLLDVTTVRRTMGRSAGTTDVIVTIAPRADMEDSTRATAIRMGDLVNATGVAESDRGLGSHCQVIRATRTSMADFIWTVDTSGSMGDDQVRLGNTASAFFTRMAAAGVDFRVGVITAGSTTLNLDSPGFVWILGTDPLGARRLCEQVTSPGLGTCPSSTTDTVGPYPMGGSTEEPTSAGVLTTHEFRRRTLAGETNINRRFRTGAQIVTFHVTDEPGSNDFTRYFNHTNDPQTGTPWGTVYNAASLGNIVTYFRRNSILTFGLVPRNTTACSAYAVADLPRCVIEGNGGAVIPITTATAPEVDAAMVRIVEAIAGASSEFVLERTPITSTIKVRVRGMDVPRSRTAGFDYEAASHSVIFYGATHRPRVGDEVVISYRIWQPCPAEGAMCVTDAECCAPHTCTGGRCMPPCRPVDGMCTTNSDCCAPNVCVGGTCRVPMSCWPLGTPCMRNEDCCSPNLCIDGMCAPCRPRDAMCTTNNDCCTRNCVMGRCGAPPCQPLGGRCTSPADCCSSSCYDGVCGPG